MQSKIERTVQGQLDASSTPCLHESIHKLQRIFFRLTGPLEIKKKSFKHIVHDGTQKLVHGRTQPTIHKDSLLIV